jgi:hypothetical protein
MVQTFYQAPEIQKQWGTSEGLTKDLDDDAQALHRSSEARDVEGIRALLLRARSQLGEHREYKATAGSTLSWCAAGKAERAIYGEERLPAGLLLASWIGQGRSGWGEMPWGKEACASCSIPEWGAHMGQGLLLPGIGARLLWKMAGAEGGGHGEGSEEGDAGSSGAMAIRKNKGEAGEQGRAPSMGGGARAHGGGEQSCCSAKGERGARRGSLAGRCGVREEQEGGGHRGMAGRGRNGELLRKGEEDRKVGWRREKVSGG